MQPYRTEFVCDQLFYSVGSISNCASPEIRISFKRLEGLSYNILEVMEVLKSTQELEKSVQEMVPTEAGLILRPHGITSITARKICLKYKQQQNIWKQSQNYSSLPKARKCGWPKTQSFGERPRNQ